jgi:glutathione S-transferase
MSSWWRVLENRLSLANPYLFGDWFTAADVIVGGALDWAIKFDMFPKTPALSAYAQRMAPTARLPARLRHPELLI